MKRNSAYKELEQKVKKLKKTAVTYKQAKKNLIAEHIFRKAIEESIPSGISGFDMEGHQIYVNRVFCEMVGWPEEELIGAKYPPPNSINLCLINWLSKPTS